MNMKYLIVILALPFSPTHAVDYQDIVIYRGMDGKLTESSKNSLMVLGQEAKERGQVTVWVMLDMNYEFDNSKRNSAVKQAEASEKASLIDSVVKPSQDVSIQPTPKGLEETPGVMLKVTEKGLVDLLKDQRVKHVTYHPDN